MFNREMQVIFRHWITEREAIRERKESGARKPWTKDPILRTVRFCNVRRMDDKVSKWLMDNWYDPVGLASELVIAAAVARLINWPDTLAVIGKGRHWGCDWKPALVKRRLQERFDAGEKTFTSAYKVITNTEGSKIEQIVRHIDAVASAKCIVDPLSLRNTWTRLMEYPGFGSFLAGQVVADLRHTLCMWPRDAMVWAPIGPGSRRGMRRLLGMPVEGTMGQEEFDGHMVELMATPLVADFRTHDGNTLEAMDVQNCLCEFDKYVRYQNGEGNARNKYPG